MFKKTVALLGALILCFSLFGCHNTYYNDGSDFTSPEFNNDKENKPFTAPTDESGISDFEKNFLKEVFGEDFTFKGYDQMTEEEKQAITKYFKRFNEGYYTVGFENGFFYTQNEFEGKEIYSIPWGSEKLTQKLPEPDIGVRTKTSVSQSTGFNAEYKDTYLEDVETYCNKLLEEGLEEIEAEGENVPDILDENRLFRSFKTSEGYIVSVVFADGVLRVNVREKIAE